MGRKPNPTILEYFDRGAKLDDASNRYQHTCKKCGELFPKGRIDSLVTHITKKCNAISLPERTEVVLRIHSLAGPEPKTSGITKLSRGKAVELPYSPSRKENFDGLNVLAEASRRVGATDHTRENLNNSGLHGQTLPVDPALEIDAFPAGFLSTPDETLNVRTTGASSATTAPPLPPIFSYLPAHVNSHDDSGNFSSLETSLPSHLSSIAASANDMMHIDSDMDISTDNISVTLYSHLSGLNGALTGPIGAQGRNLMNWQNIPQGHGSEQEHLPTSEPESISKTTLQATEHRATNGPRPIAINPESRPAHFVAESGTATKTQRPKVRGRFTADRRKEVQQVRKQGACIRCRMLKKPCSGETPCSTCRNVESARLWKHQCIRTRIAEEFTLFSAGLHSIIAFHDISNVKASISFEAFHGRIEVFHSGLNFGKITLSGLKGQLSRPDVGLGSDLPTPVPEMDVFILDTEGDDVNTKVEQYLHDMTSHFVAREPGPLIQATLLLASTLAEEKHDDLILKVLELWTATAVLTDTEMRWDIAANPNKASLPANSSSLSEPQSPDDHVLVFEKDIPYSYSLINSQLRASVERRGGALSKAIMNEIERRLLQRQTSSRFETFLSSLIFLNCVERFCWLFLTWNGSEDSSVPWPLEKQPKPYVEQGDRIADILDMLLRMRGLAPKSKPRLDTGVLLPVEDEEGLATRWFSNVNIDQRFLDQCLNAEFDRINPRSLDGKCLARVLRPEAVYT